MAVYLYQCQSCGFELTKTQSFSASPLRQCPECHGRQMRRVLQSSAIVPKGSGRNSTEHHTASGQALVRLKRRHKADHALDDKGKD